MVLVDITASSTEKLVRKIRGPGGAVVDNFPQFSPVRASVPLSRMEEIAGLADVKFIRPAYPVMFNNTDFEGVVTHRDDTARSTFFVDGSNAKVGVLSDSIDYLAQAQANGSLGLATVLPGQNGTGKGEGTAMLEIIHAMAPGAQLYFATAGNNGTEKQTATNLLNMRFTYGCDIIVDDFTGIYDSPFQEGPFGQAIDAVTTSGALYFSSSANSGNFDRGTSGTWEGDFLSGGSAGFTNGFFHNFGTAASPTNYNTITQSAQAAAYLYWSDPLDHATNDYDLYVLDSSESSIVQSSINVGDQGQEPAEALLNPVTTGQRLVIVLASGAPRFLHLDALRAHLALGTPGSTRGHNAIPNAICVAAVDTATAFPGPFTGGAANPVETFSSDGPRRMFFYPDGTPIMQGNFSSTGGAVYQKPDITAGEGVCQLERTIDRGVRLIPEIGNRLRGEWTVQKDGGRWLAELKRDTPAPSTAPGRATFTPPTRTASAPYVIRAWSRATPSAPPS